jgi:hypothetical protein
MTNEQEQLIQAILAGLANANPVGYYRDGYECLLCDGETSLARETFQHTPQCPLILASRLAATLHPTVEQ